MSDDRLIRVSGDPLLTDYGIVVALRALAKNLDGRDPHDAEAVLEWAVNTGLVLPDPQARGRVVLTRRGGSMVWLFWKAWEEKRDEDRAACALQVPTGGSDG